MRDTSGKVLARYDRIGQGPGELIRPTRFVVTEDRLFFFSKFMRKILVLDHDLNFLEEKMLPGPTYGMAWVDGSFLFTWHDQKTGKMVHRFDALLKPLNSFGSAIADDSRAEGNQIGLVGAFGDRLYFVHCFRPVLEIYTISGEHIKSVAYPATFPLDYKRIVKQINVSESGNLYLTLNRFDRRERHILRWRAREEVWEVRACKMPTYVGSDDGIFVLSVKDDDVHGLIPERFGD